MTENWGQNLVCKLPNSCGWNFWFPFHFQNRHIRWPSCKISWLLLEVHNSFTVLLHYFWNLHVTSSYGCSKTLCGNFWWFNFYPILVPVKLKNEDIAIFCHFQLLWQAKDIQILWFRSVWYNVTDYFSIFTPTNYNVN